MFVSLMGAVAVAGRRPDPPGAGVQRFPEAAVPFVRDRIRSLFERERPSHLVSSAAAGADLLALQVAQEMSIKCTVVLPFEASQFRSTSVADKGAVWTSLFDKLIAPDSGNVAVIQLQHDLSSVTAAYRDASKRILDTAVELNPIGLAPWAVAIWDEVSRGGDDMTELFIRSAIARGFRLSTVPTMPSKYREK
jgi:hypothetical protein